MLEFVSTLRHWSRGIRLYLSLGIVLVTAEVWWWSDVTFDSPQLRIIRMQEVFAWLSIGLLVVTLLIGPLTKAVPRLPGKPVIRDARRIIGIGAAWFALLHASVVYSKQFGGSNPFELPRSYQQALLLGLIGLVALLLLAFTSVNAIMKAWGVWWFRLHRLVYVAALTVLLHAFMVGAHATSLAALIVLGSVSAVWLGLHTYLLLKRPDRPFWYIITLTCGTVLLIVILNYGLAQYLDRGQALGGHVH